MKRYLAILVFIFFVITVPTSLADMDYSDFLDFCSNTDEMMFESSTVKERQLSMLCKHQDILSEKHWEWLNGSDLDWANFAQNMAIEHTENIPEFAESGIRESLVVYSWVSGRESFPPPFGAYVFFAYHDENKSIRHFEKKFQISLLGEFTEMEVPPPRQQSYKSNPDKVICTTDRYLLQKESFPFEPACVKKQSVGELIKRGWKPSNKLWNAVTSYVTSSAPPDTIFDITDNVVESPQQVSGMVGFDVKVPSYLPDNYEIRLITVFDRDNSVIIYANDKEITNNATQHDFIWKDNGIAIYQKKYTQPKEKFIEYMQKRVKDRNAHTAYIQDNPAFLVWGSIGYGKGGELRPSVPVLEMLDGDQIIEIHANLPEWQLFTITRSVYHEKADVVIPHGSADPTQQVNLIPKHLTVLLGINNTISWINLDQTPSTLSADHGRWGTGLLMPGERADVTFNKTGVYEYHGEPHPWKVGTITVLDDSTPTDTDSDNELPYNKDVVTTAKSIVESGLVPVKITGKTAFQICGLMKIPCSSNPTFEALHNPKTDTATFDAKVGLHIYNFTLSTSKICYTADGLNDKYCEPLDVSLIPDGAGNNYTLLSKDVKEWKAMSYEQLNQYHENYGDNFYTELGRMLIKDRILDELDKQNIGVKHYGESVLVKVSKIDTSLPPDVYYYADVNGTDGKSYRFNGGTHANDIIKFSYELKENEN